MTERRGWIHWNTLAVTCFLAVSPGAQALEISSGDAEPMPVGATAVLVYGQHAERKSLYSGGSKVPGSNRLSSDAGLLRVVHALHLSSGLVIEPQFILPVASLNAGADLSSLGTARGTGDLIVAVPIKLGLNTALGDMLSFVPALSLPTGRYRSQEALNAGDNRWGLIMQVAYVHRFTREWLLDAAVDVTLAADNDDYGPQKARYAQKAKYELQAYLGHLLMPTTRLSFGIGHVTGGQASIEGAPQGQGLRTSYGRVALAHFLTPTLQLQTKLGRDLDVHQGFKEDYRLELRLATIF